MGRHEGSGSIAGCGWDQGGEEGEQRTCSVSGEY